MAERCWTHITRLGLGLLLDEFLVLLEPTHLLRRRDIPFVRPCAAQPKPPSQHSLNIISCSLAVMPALRQHRTTSMPRTWRAVENRTGDNGEAASTEGVVHELESHHDQAVVHLPILPAGCQAPPTPLQRGCDDIHASSRKREVACAHM